MPINNSQSREASALERRLAQLDRERESIIAELQQIKSENAAEPWLWPNFRTGS